jgi:serine protease Do
VDELDLEAEAQAASRGDGGAPNAPEEQPSTGFGMSLGNITPDVARRLRLDDSVRGAVVMDVDPQSPAARAGITPGDVILRVNRRPVSSAADASRELAQIRSGGTALVLVLRNGQETFLTMTKE